MNVGWKTITGSVLIAAAVLIKGFFPEYSEIATALEAVGIGLGGIGVRTAISKAGAK